MSDTESDDEFLSADEGEFEGGGTKTAIKEEEVDEIMDLLMNKESKNKPQSATQEKDEENIINEDENKSTIKEPEIEQNTSKENKLEDFEETNESNNEDKIEPTKEKELKITDNEKSLEDIIATEYQSGDNMTKQEIFSEKSHDVESSNGEIPNEQNSVKLIKENEIQTVCQSASKSPEVDSSNKKTLDQQNDVKVTEENEIQHSVGSPEISVSSSGDDTSKNESEETLINTEAEIQTPDNDDKQSSELPIVVDQSINSDLEKVDGKESNLDESKILQEQEVTEEHQKDSPPVQYEATETQNDDDEIEAGENLNDLDLDETEDEIPLEIAKEDNSETIEKEKLASTEVEVTEENSVEDGPKSIENASDNQELVQNQGDQNEVAEEQNQADTNLVEDKNTEHGDGWDDWGNEGDGDILESKEEQNK
jgi:hypothetical protein